MKFHSQALSLSLFYLASVATRPLLASAEDIFPGPPDSDDTNNRYFVRFKSSEALDTFLDTPSIQTVGGVPQLNATVLEFDSEEEATQWGADHPDVSYVVKDEIDYPIRTRSTAQAAAETTAAAEETPYGIAMVKALDIPDYVEGSGIKMCIIDSGYALGHEDLQTDRVTGRGDLCASTSCPWDEDDIGRGTHVAGTILALGDNDKGVVGVVKTGKMPVHIVRVFDASGSTSRSNVITAMWECLDAGANVVNMSIGGGGSSQYEDAIPEIIKESNGRILFVAAAGNGGDISYTYPASIPQVVSVASVTSSKARSGFSQYNDQVDIAAPGSSVLSTTPNNGYSSYSSTDFATPHVAGVAAKIWSHAPWMSADELLNILQDTAEDLGDTGRDDYFGHGLVNAKAAFDALGPPPPTTSPAPTSMPSPSPTKAPTVAPTSPPTATPSCEDSPLKVLIGQYPESARRCKWIGVKRPNKCDWAKIASHCPATCGMCDQYGSVNSTGQFLYKNVQRDCAWVEQQADDNFVFFKELITQTEVIMKTCRGTVARFNFNDE